MVEEEVGDGGGVKLAHGWGVWGWGMDGWTVSVERERAACSSNESLLRGRNCIESSRGFLCRAGITPALNIYPRAFLGGSERYIH